MSKIFNKSVLDQFIKFPQFGWGAVSSFERNFFSFNQNWLFNSFEIVLQPLLYFLAFGFGLNMWIGDVEGLQYPKFVLYGLLCVTAMSTSLFESAQGVHERYFIKNNYKLLKTCPVSFSELILGEWLWSIARSFLACSIILIVGSSLEMISVVEYLPVLLVCLWISIIFSSLGIFLCSKIHSFTSLLHTCTMTLIPLFLFTGVFFPISRLPKWLSQLMELIPVTNAIQWLRHLHDKQFLSLNNILLIIMYLLISFVLFTLAIQNLESTLEANLENRSEA